MKRNIKVISILFILVIIAIMFFNCESLLGSSCPPVDPNSTYFFWALNLNTGLLHQNDAYCQIGTRDPVHNTGGYAYVYVQYQHYDEVIAQKVADEFDAMYSTITNKFGDPVKTNNNELDGNGDRRVTILLLDIMDGFDPVFNPAYIGGYFYSVDYLTQQSLIDAGYTSDKSNEQAIIYIDINPQDPTTNDVLSTIAHEFQHMINFSENILEGTGWAELDELLNDSGVPTWIDEGFAMAAEQIWATEVKSMTNAGDWPVYSRISYFNDSSRFTEGNPLIKWIGSEAGYDVLSNYSTSFLFFQYMRIHASSGNDIFGTIMADHDYTNNGVTQINNICNPQITTAADFDGLLDDWVIANKINSLSGEYGYKDALGLKDVDAWSGGDSKTWEFYPGSFIYRKEAGTVSAFPSGIEAHRFDSSGWLEDCSTTGCDVVSGEYLVIYNPESNPDGIAISVSVPTGTAESGAVFKSDYDPTKPHRIDWIITKPFSEYFVNNQGRPPLRLPEHDDKK